MASSPRLEHALAAVLGTAVTRLSPIPGGDINDAYRASMADGRQLFVKTHATAPPHMYTTEAAGLRWLAKAGAIRVPEVVAATEPDTDSPGLLVLEYIESARADADYDERLGHELAALHRSSTATFGLDHDNFIGTLVQDNTTGRDWADFYATRRLLPQLAMAEKAGRATPRLRREIERLIARLPGLVGDPEPPARLHGDLWGGNAMTDEHGLPCLIDPATYAGHREVDLAMMRLFGGFSERTFAAYHGAFPLSDGAEERVPLYQLYPLLVHLNLFGGHYGSRVEQLLDRF